MATLRKRGSKWQAQVRVQGAPPVSRSFAVRKDAEVWAKEIELSIFRNGSPASDQSLKKTTLDQLLERYERTVTPTKKGRGPESYMLRTLRRHAIARLALDKLTSASVASYRDDRVKSVSPSTVRRGEILAFRWRDIDPRIPAVHLRDTKNGHPRTAPLSPAALAALPIPTDARPGVDRRTDRGRGVTTPRAAFGNVSLAS